MSHQGRVSARLLTVVVVAVTSLACSGQYVRECNAVKSTVEPIVSRMDATSAPNDVVRLFTHVNDRVQEYDTLADRLEKLSVRTPELLSSVQDYAKAARSYAREAEMYAIGLDQRSPEKMEVARARATVEHRQLVAASRSVATWCEPFGPK